MDFRELFLIQHARSHTAEVGRPDMSTQDQILHGVTADQMRLCPRPGFNSLAWLLWHMTRGEDVGVNVIIAERPQVLDEGDWLRRMNILRRDGGTGMTAPEVDEFNEQIDVDALLAYRVAVGRRARETVREMQLDVLDEVIDAGLVQRARDEGAFGPNAEWAPQRWEGKTKAFTLSWTVLGHSVFTLGECYVVRGLLGLPTI
jgi:hypothetical protein